MTTYKKPQPVMVLGAITTGLTVIFGGLTTVAGLEGNPTVALVAGIGMLTTAAINASKDYWLKEQVVPLEDTAAYRDRTGTVVTGPAGPGIEGVPVDLSSLELRANPVFDKGGDLPAGVGEVRNDTGNPEPVAHEITEDDLR